MSFLFIDNITQFSPGQHAVGIKHLSPEDHHYFIKNSAGECILIPCLLAECIGQLCAWLVMQKNNFSLRPIAILYDEIQFFADAKIGDDLTITTQLHALDEKTSLFDGTVSVNGKTLLTVRHAAGAFLPMQEFIDPLEVAHQCNEIIKPNPKNVFEKNILKSPPIEFAYDEIILKDSEQFITAKNIASNYDFFADHFPRKHVLPISLLLQNYIKLAEEFIGDSRLQIHKITKVKIKEFILPGMRLITKLVLKEKNSEGCRLKFVSEVDNKKICMAELEFR